MNRYKIGETYDDTTSTRQHGGQNEQENTCWMQPLTGTIFAGIVLKDGRTWGTGKQDVTIDALVAVAEHATKFGRPVEITGPDGKLEYRITVEAF